MRAYTVRMIEPFHILPNISTLGQPSGISKDLLTYDLPFAIQIQWVERVEKNVSASARPGHHLGQVILMPQITQ